jgi:hypothetical protein
MKTIKLPSYRLHRTGQAFVQIKGRRYYLGKHGTEESLERYRRMMGELAAMPTIPPSTGTAGITVTELCLAYLRWAEGYYAKQYLPTIRLALRTMRELYGSTEAAAFGPLALRAIQQRFVEAGRARNYINNI